MTTGLLMIGMPPVWNDVLSDCSFHFLKTISDTWVMIAFVLMFYSSRLLKIAETGSSAHVPSLGTKSTTRFSAALEAKENSNQLVLRGNLKEKPCRPSNLMKVWLSDNNNSFCQVGES